MAGVVTRVVDRLSARPASTASTYTITGVDYDFAIGGIPFLSAASKEHPIVRKTAPYRKDQIDQTPVPGEQSMVFWWLRSQISFHGGTGIKFEEPALDPTILYSDPKSAQSIPVRFQDGEGVDVWTTPGQFSLLPTTSQSKSAAGNVILEGCIDASGNDMWLQAEGTALDRCVDGSYTSITWGGTGTILSLTNDGTNYYAADDVGIWKGTLAGGAGSKIWDTGSSPVLIKWAKDRLVACIGASVYELAGGAPPTLPTALFTPQYANWTWTAIEEGPDSIFIAGYNGALSKIWSISLGSDTGNVPILASPVEVATLPAGEQVFSLRASQGSFLAIGTNKGVRVADIGTSGRLSWGPLLCTVTPSNPVRSIATYDRFIYCAFSNGMSDGTSGLIRIDLGFEVQVGRFAYAKDLMTHVAGTVRSVAPYGASGRLVMAVDGNGSYLQHSTNLEPTGYLQTGNIRFHTQEDKLYKYIKLQTAPLANGTVEISYEDSQSGNSTIVTLGSTSTSKEVAFPASLGPREWVNLTFTLARDGGDATKGPTVYSYQVKALPAQKNQRQIILSLLCFDQETDRQGVKKGYNGYARDRLTALETLEEARDNIMFQDLQKYGMPAQLVVIDDITFEQTDPPANFDGLGGVAMVTLRSVT